jgi:predicted dehydrogenase
MYLRGAIGDPACAVEQPVAVAGDGHDNDAAAALRAGIPQAAWYDDYRTMLDRHKPDMVNIGAVYGYIGDVAADVLERGISVVCDKPVAASWRQLERLRQVLAKGHARLITEFNMRSLPAYCAAKNAVKQGVIGEVVLVTAQKSYRFGTRPAWFGSRESFGGLMLWVASHAIDFVAYCTGRRFARVSGIGGNLSRADYPEMEDHVSALFQLDNGGSAVVHADYLRPGGAPTHGDDRLRIAGTKGIIEIMHERCHLIDAGAPREITGDARVEPIHRELLAAARGERTDVYSTAHSLEMAAVLLHARDAQDRRSWIDISQGRPLPR